MDKNAQVFIKCKISDRKLKVALIWTSFLSTPATFIITYQH